MEQKENLSMQGKGGSQYSDPTYNVMALVEASVKRLDDLNEAQVKRLDEKIHTHFEHIRELTIAESKRIDAIRAVDVGAVAIASERAAAQAIVLANQVSTSAETLRTLVASTAATVATQLQQVSSQLTERIALLEKNQYSTPTGLSSVPPQLLDRLTILERGASTSAGRGAGMEKMWGWIVAAVMAAIAIYKEFS